MRILIRRTLLIILLVVALVLASPFSQNVFADDACSVAGFDDPLLCGTPGSDEETKLQMSVKNVLDTVYVWIGIIAVIVLVISGATYMTSMGEPDKIKRAKNGITYSLVGLVVTLAAFAITSFFIGALDGASIGDTIASDDSGRSGESRTKVRHIASISKASILPGQKVTLKAKVIPDYAVNKKLTFKSSDNSIATVSADGVVRAKKSGEVTISISSSDGPTKDVTIVVKKPIPVTDIVLSTNSVEIKKGKTATVKATPLPSNATDKTLIWASKDAKIATVSQNGVIKALKEGGNTKVTVTAQNAQTVAYDSVFLTAANFQLASSKKVTKTISVSIPGTKLDFSYKGNGSVKSRFSSDTLRIVENHLYDVNAQNFYSYIKKKGGFASYAKSLGGVFGAYYGKTIKGRTEYDFQRAAEYVLGWMYMYGWDYMNSSGRHGLWGTGSSYTDDAFYAKGGFRSKYSGKFDDVISGKYGVGMMASECGDLETFIYEKLGMSNRKEISPKVTKLSDLKVGDGIYFFDHRVDKTRENGWGIGEHNVVVGEVTDTEITFYDAGSHYQQTRNYKRKVKIPKPYSEEQEYENIRKAFGYAGWGMRRWYNFKK